VLLQLAAVAAAALLPESLPLRPSQPLGQAPML
jgi:hypothetical protein